MSAWFEIKHAATCWIESGGNKGFAPGSGLQWHLRFNVYLPTKNGLTSYHTEQD